LYKYSDIVGEANQLLYNKQTAYIVLILNILYLIAVFFAARLNNKYQTPLYKANNVLEYTKKLYQSNNFIFILVNASFTFIVTTFVSRLVTILEWVLFGIFKENFFNSNYSKIKALLPFNSFGLVFSFITIFISIPLWFYLEHLKSQKMINHLNKNKQYNKKHLLSKMIIGAFIYFKY